jgi:hypothetical protein
MATAEAVGVVGVDRVAILAGNSAVSSGKMYPACPRRGRREAEGRVHVADDPRGKAVLGMRHVGGAEEPAQVGEREHLSGHRCEDAVADLEGGNLAFDLVA